MAETTPPLDNHTPYEYTGYLSNGTNGWGGYSIVTYALVCQDTYTAWLITSKN